MSTATLRSSGTGRRAPGDLARPTRLLATLILAIGPAAVAVLRFIIPYHAVDDPHAMAAAVAGNLGNQSAVLWLGLIATMTLAPAVIWVGRLTYRQAPRLTTTALALAVPGYCVLGVILTTDALMWTGLHNGLDVQTVGGLVANSHPATAAGEVIFVLGHLVGTVLLGIALWRTRAIPVWAAVLVTISQPLHLAAVLLASPHLDLTAWMMTAVGFAVAGAASLDDGRLPRGGPAASDRESADEKIAAGHDLGGR